MLEVGRARKTVFVARYLQLRELQREVEEGLNVMEASNGVGAVIAYGKGGEIASNRRDEQEMFGLCLRILQSALVYVNTSTWTAAWASPRVFPYPVRGRLRTTSQLSRAEVKCPRLRTPRRSTGPVIAADHGKLPGLVVVVCGKHLVRANRRTSSAAGHEVAGSGNASLPGWPGSVIKAHAVPPGGCPRRGRHTVVRN